VDRDWEEPRAGGLNVLTVGVVGVEGGGESAAEEVEDIEATLDKYLVLQRSDWAMVKSTGHNAGIRTEEEGRGEGRIVRGGRAEQRPGWLWLQLQMTRWKLQAASCKLRELQGAAGFGSLGREAVGM
jgi:hypothetical protein